MDVKKEFSQFFLLKVRNKLVLLEQEREKSLRFFVIIETIIIIGLIQLVRKFFMKNSSFEFSMVHIPLIIGIALTALNAKLSFSSYKKKYKNNILDILFKEMLEDFIFYPNLYLNEVEYKNSLLFQGNYNEFKGEDLIEGKINGISFKMSELIIKYVTRDSKNKSEQIVFRGIMIVSPGSQKFLSETVVEPDILEKSFGSVIGRFLQNHKPKSLPLVLVEGPEFEREFKVTGNDQVEARRVITPRMQEHLLELKQKSNMRFGMSLANDQITVALPTSKNYFEPPLFSSCVETKTLREIITVFELLTSIHDELSKL